MGAASSVNYDTEADLNYVQKRASAMLKASFISDAASMPLHWIYDQSVIADKLASQSEASAAFFPTPSCPFYKYPAGVLSPYGDESLPLIHSIANQGDFVREHAAHTMFDFFAKYPTVEGESKGYEGRLNHAPKSFLAARQEGKEWADCSQDDSQANGLAKVPIIIARYAGASKEVIDEKVASMVGILQTPEVCQQTALLLARLLNTIIVNSASNPISSPRQAIIYVKDNASAHGLSGYQQNILDFLLDEEKIKQWTSFSAALQAAPADPNDGHRLMRVRGPIFSKYIELSMDLEEAIRTAGLNDADTAFVQEHGSPDLRTAEVAPSDVLTVALLIGLNCHLPCALVVALYITLHASDFTEAVNLNIKAGGDSCSRSLVIGAMYGALPDVAIPEHWLSSVNPNVWRVVTSSADKIAADNKNLVDIFTKVAEAAGTLFEVVGEVFSDGV